MQAYRRLWHEAHAAGHAAAAEIIPAPMLVANMAGTVVDRVDDGVCGFGWVELNGREGFTRWAKQQGLLDPYGSRPMVWVYDYGQSMTRKAAYARAFAAVLQQHNVTAHARSRMD